MQQHSNNKKLALALASLSISMIFFSFAAVPLYSLFCKVTGFGGTPKQGFLQRQKIGVRQLMIEFDANVEPKLAWRFVPKQSKVEVTPGQNVLIFYEAENLSSNDIVGTATYNITPAKAAPYFIKIHCFCFEEQLLKAKEKMQMPVAFCIDPAFENDPEMEDIKVITLSYSFFKIREIKEK